MHKQVMQLSETQTTYESFFHKRKAFEHEKEVRVLVDDIRWYQALGMCSMGANWKIYERMQEISEDRDRLDEIEKRLTEYMGHWVEKEIPMYVYLPIKKLNEYISTIKVYPMAEKWYVELIKGLCEEQNINFEGQSNLYGKAE